MLERIQSLFDSLDRKQLIALAIISIVCICVMGYYLYNCMYPKTENFEEYNEEFDPTENLAMEVSEDFANNAVHMRMFHVPWCGYCKTAKPVFKDFQDEMNGKTINGRKVNVEMIDCEDKANEGIVKQFESEIKGYPTIILTKDGENIHYNGERESKSNFIEYIKEMLN